MHRPLSALDVGPKVSSALRVLPHRATEPHEKQFSPVPKVSDDVQNYPP